MVGRDQLLRTHRRWSLETGEGPTGIAGVSSSVSRFSSHVGVSDRVKMADIMSRHGLTPAP
jgi:hypothetical protein